MLWQMPRNKFCSHRSWRFDLRWWLKSNIMQNKTHLLGAVLLLLLFGLSPPLSGQDMARSVVGNAGDYYENLLFGNLHFTVGEVAVSRFQNGQELDEGFHRVYYDLVVKTDSPLPEEWAVQVYPNPTTSFLRVELESFGTVRAQLFNGTGQAVLDIPHLQSGEELDLSLLPAGAYWLRLQDEEGRRGHFQVQKIAR